MITNVVWTTSTDYETEQARNMLARIREWVTEFYGSRCLDYVPTCMCCEAWRAVDVLAAGVDGEHLEGMHQV